MSNFTEELSHQEFENRFLRGKRFWRAEALELKETLLYPVFERLCSACPDHPADTNTTFYLVENRCQQPRSWNVFLHCSHFEHGFTPDIRALLSFIELAESVLTDRGRDLSSIELLDGNAEELVLQFYSPREEVIELLKSFPERMLREHWEEKNLDIQERFESHRAPEPVGAFPHAKRVGNLLFLSGIGPRKRGSKDIPGVTFDAAGNVVDYDIEAQTRAVFENVRFVLEDAGSGWEHIVDVQVFLTNMKRDFPTFNKIYAEHFAGPGMPNPTRTTVEVGALPTPIAVELKVIATMP